MINFLKYRYLYLIISLAVLVPGIASLAMWGLAPSIDFVGGTIIEIQKSGVEMSNLMDALQKQNIEIESIKEETDTYIIRSKPIDRSQWEEAKHALEDVGRPADSDEPVFEQDTGEENVETSAEESVAEDALTFDGQALHASDSADFAGSVVELRFETVGPILGAELLRKTMVAAALAVVGILLYVAWAFKNIRYGVSAILALFHDMLVVIGIFSLLGHFYGVEVDVLFVTAVLTTMSFSVHDTIVVFDRIRESLRRDNLPFDVTVNKALTETMSRSVNNSMTIAFMLLALVLLGGETIKWFSVALLIGTISGTYSSPFVATQLLYLLLRKKLSDK